MVWKNIGTMLGGQREEPMKVFSAYAADPSKHATGVSERPSHAWGAQSELSKKLISPTNNVANIQGKKR
eukprot:m.36908 g.36908  ORF g.36908 m.36908 type:complete len:69 (+) comp11318_c0_seq2:261-467(+)